MYFVGVTLGRLEAGYEHLAVFCFQENSELFHCFERLLLETLTLFLACFPLFQLALLFLAELLKAQLVYLH